MTFDKNDSQYLSDIEIVQPTVLRALPRTVKCFYEPTKPPVQLWHTPFDKFQPNLDVLKLSNLMATTALCLLKFISPGPNLMSYKMLFGIFFFHQIVKSFASSGQSSAYCNNFEMADTILAVCVRKILRPPDFVCFITKAIT